MKKTKIIATMGPASVDKEILKQMIIEGVNVCRLNFSHGSHEFHEKTIDMINEINDELHYNVAILGDLQGPKIRTRKMNDNVMLIPNSIVTISTTDEIGTADKFSINYTQLPQDVQKGERILLDDGKLTLEIVKSNGTDEIKAKR